MKLFKRNVNALVRRHAKLTYSSNFTPANPLNNEEYSKSPQYPPIEKINPESEEGQKRSWYDKIKRQLTVEEKLFEVNVQRRHGWKCFMVREGVIPFNNLEFAQHMTKTHVIQTEHLPSFYSSFSEKSDTLAKQIRNDVIDAIEYQLEVRHSSKPDTEETIGYEKEVTKFIVTELNRILTNSLFGEANHLRDVQVDYSPRVEAAWKVESLVETFVRELEKNQLPVEETPEEFIERPTDKYLQYEGCPILQLRSQNPLPHIIEPLEVNALSYSVPVYKYDPHYVLGYEINRRHLNNIPGFWPGEEKEFSFISYHDSNHLKYRPPTFGPEDTREALISQALFASFGWLLPVACYQGFSSFHDVTYPLVTQTVLTDGREFTFGVYQMNTTELHWENLLENLKTNICWITSTKPLYEVIENGKIKGFNEEVLNNLVQLYVNPPKPLINVELKPYLGKTIKHIADYEEDEKVKWLQEKFKIVSANREVNTDTLYEVRDWERIYKIMFPMRPQDARRRPFELRQNPFKEKMSDNFKEYIPKALRPDKHLPKYKQRKFKRSFFPE